MQQGLCSHDPHKAAQYIDMQQRQASSSPAIRRQPSVMDDIAFASVKKVEALTPLLPLIEEVLRRRTYRVTVFHDASHRELLELLVENPGAMEELGLTHERVQELLLRGQEPASDTDDTLDV